MATFRINYEMLIADLSATISQHVTVLSTELRAKSAPNFQLCIMCSYNF
jgi:hypothetical protein